MRAEGTVNCADRAGGFPERGGGNVTRPGGTGRRETSERARTDGTMPGRDPFEEGTHPPRSGEWRGSPQTVRKICDRLTGRESNPGWTRTTDLLFVRQAPSPLGYGVVSSSAPARIRTWNAAFVARHDVPFHHQGVERKGRELNPSPPQSRAVRVSSAARRTDIRLPSGVRRRRQWSRGESNPDAVLARHSSSPLASPTVTGVGVEPTPVRLSTSPLYQLGYPVVPVADPGVEPGLQAYETRTGAGPSAIPVARPGLEPGRRGHDPRPGACPRAMQ